MIKTYKGYDYKLTGTTTSAYRCVYGRYVKTLKPVYAIRINGVWKLTLCTSESEIKEYINDHFMPHTFYPVDDKRMRQYEEDRRAEEEDYYYS